MEHQSMNTPDFDDLTPPDELRREWMGHYTAINFPDFAAKAARWGARHGWEQARQLQVSPDPITDRRPTEKDGDKWGDVVYLTTTGCTIKRWDNDFHSLCPWVHTPNWQPHQPTLQEQALKALDELSDDEDGYVRHRIDIIRHALEQAHKDKKK